MEKTTAIYHHNKANYSKLLTQIVKKHNTISILRLVTVGILFISIYYFVQSNKTHWIVLGILSLISFIILMRFHTKLVLKKRMTQALIRINEDEISYLTRKTIPFENGQEFVDTNHPYAYDLDIFGNQSLFQNLNRTATFIGKKTLANQLLLLLDNDTIIQNQEAIKELKDKLNWRQEFLALAKINPDSESQYTTLLKWRFSNHAGLSSISRIISYIAPLLFIGLAILYSITLNPIWASLLTYSFIFNLVFLGFFLKRIRLEINQTTTIEKINHQYSLLLKKIEDEKFQSKKLCSLQDKLKSKKENASNHFHKLAQIFSNLDSISNYIASILLNGSILYHFHVFESLIKWKKEHSNDIKNWLDVIGEIEMLNSLANFGYNNPDFVFPTINNRYEVSFSNLSHPLLNPTNRVANDIAFQPQSFIILTGSNMSGKSTFLRSLGVNMVLTGIGAPTCATQANVHPLSILVSMRLSDSLSDSESYFFAEIKRLKQIMDELEHQPAFVLLDEILRGTNSDDKRSGTVEVLKKIITKKSFGIIATHDVEVCLTTNQYPEILANKYFEVNSIGEELLFDYKLKDGVCKNKSATFIMKKMGVI